jgi:nicotinate-nucleotide--dimethylbenzimidazole phosphoribosyltransferase
VSPLQAGDEAAQDGTAGGETAGAVPAMPDLAALARTVAAVDEPAAAAAQTALGSGYGRLTELAAWLAATSGGFPARVRCAAIGIDPAQLETVADAAGVGLVAVPAEASVPAAVNAGLAAADAEVEAGAGLLVVTAWAPERDVSAAAAVSVLRGVEPVALLGRGAAAVDTAPWIERATRLRDVRRRALRHRAEPLPLLEQLRSPALAAAVGFVLAATARRTPLVLDGEIAVAAGLVVADLAPDAAQWWLAADAVPSPVHGRACTELGLRPLLGLGASTPQAAAGLLSLPLLRAAGSANDIANRAAHR